VEQSIGRGLRLPYGKRTGVSTVDRLNIIAHDKFQEIVDEANRSDSPIHLKAIYLDKDTDFQKTKTVVASSHFSQRLQAPALVANRKCGRDGKAPV
jgi:type III restriction enzyme